jgi:hypothetical protein
VAFGALALVAGFLLFALSEQTDDWFSWTIAPPLTAAFLGASYWAAFVLFAWTVRRDSRTAAAAALVPVSLIAVLLLIATIIHSERFHHDLFGWFWKVAYALVPAALAVVVARQLRLPSGVSGGRSPLPSVPRMFLAAQGATMVAIGVSLFVAPESADALWPWDLTPLTARAIGAFVTGFGASALHAVVANDLERFEGAAAAYATLGALELLALVLHSADLTGADVDTAIYVTFLISVLLTGVYGWFRARKVSA